MLREIRQKHNISQEQLGIMIGTNRQTISRYENNYRIPSFDKFKKLCIALDLNNKQTIELLNYFAEQKMNMNKKPCREN